MVAKRKKRISRTYKKAHFRSAYALSYAKWLDNMGVEWQHAPKTFKVKSGTYSPDFYLPETDEWVDIRVSWGTGEKEKYKQFKSLYNSLKILLITEKELKKLGITK